MRWQDVFAAVGSSLCLLGGRVALAEPPQDMLAMRDQDQPPEAHSEGHAVGIYGGVALGSEHAPPRGRAAHRAPTVTWPGFQMRPDGGSAVFVQSTVALSVQPVKGERKWTIELGEVRVEGTNRLPLDTHFFNTPVTRVALARVGGKTILELTMRADVQPRVNAVDGKNGYHFLSLEFGRGQYLPVEAPKPGAAPEPSSVTGLADRGFTPALGGSRDRLLVQPEPGGSVAGSIEPPLRASRVRFAGAATNPATPNEAVDLDAVTRAAGQLDAQRAAAGAQELDPETEAALEAELPPGVAPLKGSAAAKARPHK